MRKSDLFFNALRLPVDFVMLILAGLVNYILRTKLLSFFRPVYFEFNLPMVNYLYLVIFVSLIFIGSYAISGLYSMKDRIGRVEEFLKIAVASSAGVMIVIIYIFLRQELFNSRFLVLGGWFFAIFFVFLGRLLIRKLQNYTMTRFNFGLHKTMLIGDNGAALRILNQLQSNPIAGAIVAKHLKNPEIEDVKLAIGNQGIDLERKYDGSQRVSASYGVEEMILADSNYPNQKVMELIDFCNDNHIIFKFVPNVYHTLSSNFEVSDIEGIPLIELKRTALDGWGKIIKRFIDIIVSVTGIVILSPVFLILALIIKWETEGSVFARLKRVSKNKEFMLYKFRSMIQNAEELLPYIKDLNERKDGPLFKLKNDPRITKVGRFMRRVRIDEIAQLWNVLKGDMSLVGPRPHQPDEIARYEKHHKKVLAIKAGVTGLAQVSGSSELPFEEEVALDSFYIDNWSLLIDIKLILKTALKILNDRSAV